MKCKFCNLEAVNIHEYEKDGKKTYSPLCPTCESAFLEGAESEGQYAPVAVDETVEKRLKTVEKRLKLMGLDGQNVVFIRKDIPSWIGPGVLYLMDSIDLLEPVYFTVSFGGERLVATCSDAEVRNIFEAYENEPAKIFAEYADEPGDLCEAHA